TAVDAAGNNATATQLITIQDKQAPVIQTPANITLPNSPGTCGASVTIPVPSVTDNCNPGTATASRSDGKPLSVAYPVGTTIVTWNITDAHGNKAVPITHEVKITDNEPPDRKSTR